MKQLYLFPETEKEKAKEFKSESVTDHKITNQTDIVNKRIFCSKEEYYKSLEWQKKRAFALNRVGHRCERCGYSGILQVHHLTYNNLYNEKPQDLEVLCKECHKDADIERSDETRYERGFDTFMTKKYGEDYECFDGCDEEYDDWLESKDYD